MTAQTSRRLLGIDGNVDAVASTYDATFGESIASDEILAATICISTVAPTKTHIRAECQS
jgi:hypothetical protein